jgi:hypothetical protein
MAAESSSALRVWDSPVAPAVNRDFWTSAYQAIDD